MREVNAAFVPQHPKDGIQSLFRDDRSRMEVASSVLGQTEYRQDLVRHRFRDQGQVGHAGVQSALGHAVELGRQRVLHDDQPARFVYGPDTPRAVAARARQHDGHGPLTHVLSQRAEEDVDGQGQGLRGVLVGQQQPPPRDDHLFFGGQQVDRVGFHVHAIGHAMDRNLSMPG